MKILIVDDELMIREWLSHTISALPFEISVLDTASNGLEALERTETELYDLIFIDINMPKMNGIDLLKRLYEKAIDSILIVLSSHDEFNFAREAIRYNIKEYLLKNECSKEKLTEILYSCQERLESKSKEDELSQEILERVINGNIPAKVNNSVIRDFSALAGKIFLRPSLQSTPPMEAVCLRTIRSG